MMSSPNQLMPIETIFAANVQPIFHDMTQTVKERRDLIDIKHLDPAEEILARIATNAIRTSESNVLMPETVTDYDKQYWTAARGLQIAKVTYGIARHGISEDAALPLVPELAEDAVPAFYSSLRTTLPDFIRQNQTVDQLAWTFSHDAAPTHQFVPLAHEIFMLGMLALERNYMTEQTMAEEGTSADIDDCLMQIFQDDKKPRD